MSEPRRFSPLDLERAALGRSVPRSARPGKQPVREPVTVEADLHLSIAAPSEMEGRQALQAINSALVDRGFSVTLDGPRVTPTEPAGPRRVA
jgi:hypothetical protein